MAPEEEKINFNLLAMKCGGNYAALKKYAEKHKKNWLSAWKSAAGEFLEKPDGEKEWSKLKEKNIEIVLEKDSNYPNLLKEIPYPPLALYYKGAPLQKSEKCIAIIGTRKATEVGKRLAEKFSEKLAKAGITIVSGLALGIDANAHKGALKANGKTIAVLGNGLGTIYPKENERLAKEILSKNGTLVSEYPKDLEPRPHRFLERNRIVSGLSDGILVIEAPQKSGSLSTARYAIEQNRSVWVIPGNIEHRNYHGSHELIKEGASLVTDPSDILKDLGLENSELFEKNEEILKNEKFDKESKDVILFLKATGESMEIDEIAKKLNMPINVASKTITILLLEDYIKEDQGKYFL